MEPRTAPASIRVDQGGEFIARDLDLWAYTRGVTLDFSRPGEPTDNAFIVSFNGRFRAECLNQHWFMSLNDAVRNAALGAETTMRCDRIAPSATSRLYRWSTGQRYMAQRHAEPS